MKHLLILIIAGIAVALSSCATTPEELMHKSREKCQSIENGFYEMTRFMKYSSGNDTAVDKYTCYFNKLPDDTLYPSTFHYERVSQKGLSSGVIYTGEEFVLS